MISFRKASILVLLLSQMITFSIGYGIPVVIATSGKTGDKISTMGSILIKAQVCYNRYNLCVKLVAPYFCSATSGSKAFYLWAQRMASNIMNGNRDNFNVDCTPQFTKEIIYGSLSPLVGNLIQ